MDYRLQTSGNSTDLIVEGNITIESAQAFHEALLKQQSAETDYIVDISSVDKVDLTCLQMLCSAHRAATRRGRKLTVTGISDAAKEAMDRLGFIRHVGCSDDVSCSCLWVSP